MTPSGGGPEEARPSGHSLEAPLPGRRTALVAGAVGRLGEALLSAVVSSPRYETVRVLIDRPLASTVAGLAGITLESIADPGYAWTGAPRKGAPGSARAGDSRAAGTGELDVFACWTDPADPLARTPNGRDAAYTAITDPAALRRLASAATARGARRLLILAPLAAWQQVSAAERMLPQAMELELAALAVPTVIVMRPTTERGPSASGTRMQRLVRFYLSQLRFMLPSSTHALRSIEIARAALALMAEADAPGLRVVTLDEIRQHALQRNPGPNR